MLTLRQLRFLVALADELSFSRAAERCHVTQPTLSAGLKELEDRLGVVLVERTRRSVMMTAIGEEVTARARELLVGAQEIEELASAHRAPDEGALHLGSIPTIGPYLLPRCLPALRAQFPQLRIYLREELSESLVDGVTSGRLDMALMALPFEIGPLHAQPLFEDGYHLATPLGERTPSRHSDPAPAALDLLTDAGQIMLLEKGHCLQRHALGAYPGKALAINESFSATSLPTLIAMVAEGLGVTLLPDLAVMAGAAQGQALRLTPLPGACPRKIVLVWRKSSARGAVFAQIGDALGRSHAELRQEIAEK
ncbi:MAG: LysR substrate-binding domain-containing protein [Neomegalonema sp.]|nr:LysR substrate-binding domain-containing protein [Neomegalonema sp.]